MSPTRQIVPTHSSDLRAWRFVDLRSTAAYRRGHPAGALSLPYETLERSLFLLPARRIPVAFLHTDAPCAEAAAHEVTRRGWTTVAWIEARDPLLRRSWIVGAEPVSLWTAAESLVRATPSLARITARSARRGAPARAVDLACGSGRNSVQLARLGFDVTGLDILPDALSQARRVARGAGSMPGVVSFRRADLTSPAAKARWLSRERWDAIVVFRYLDRALLPLIERALAPGGILVYETFLEEQARIHGRPRRPEFLLQPGELRAAFGELEIVEYREGPDSDDNRLATLVARRSGQNLT